VTTHFVATGETALDAAAADIREHGATAHIETGPTGTNVNDLYLVGVGPIS
jgi:glycerate-2-kinase